MQISASAIMDKMIKKLRKSQGELDAGRLDKDGMKSTLISIKVYCDLLLEELDEKQSVSDRDVLDMLQKQTAKPAKTKETPLDDDEEANGDSIFDF